MLLPFAAGSLHCDLAETDSNFMPAITIERLEKRFGYSRVLRGASMSVEAGQCYVLFGANGAGCGLNVETSKSAFSTWPLLHRAGRTEPDRLL